MKNKISILLVLLAVLITYSSAEINLLQPEDNAWNNSGNIALNYYANLNITNNETINCSLILNNLTSETHVLSNSIIDYFNFTTNVSAFGNSWFIYCINEIYDNATNTTNTTIENSATRIFNIDLDTPVVYQNAPLNNQTFNYSNITFNFTILDNSLQNITCNLTIGSTSSIITVQNNATNIYYQNLSNGTYSWNLECKDIADNFNIGSLLNFTININTTQNQSNQSNQTNSTQPFITIETDKQNYNLGEYGRLYFNALNGSNVSILICPIATGWVQCYSTLQYVNDTYPKNITMPYTNRTGNYSAEATMSYSNITMKTNATFRVINTLTAAVSGNTTIIKGYYATLTANASGGIPSYTYLWTAHDNVNTTGIAFSKLFPTAGTYNEKLFVKDAENNNYTAIIAIRVRDIFAFTVLVKDTNNNPIQGAVVQIENITQNTNTDGKAGFTLVEGTHSMYVSKDNYGVYSDDVSVNKNETINITLTIDDFEKPSIRLTTQDNDVFSSRTAELSFKAEDESTMTCNLYLATASDDWFSKAQTLKDIESDTEYTFTVTNLNYDNYKWKVECTDANGNTNFSETRNFTISNINVTSSKQDEDEIIDTLMNALENTKSFNLEQTETADALDLKNNIEDAIKEVSRLDKERYNIAFRRDLSPLQQQQYIDNMTKNAMNLAYNTPINIAVSNSNTFVKYIRDNELEPLAQEYLEASKLNQNKKSFFQRTKDIQQLIVISTKVKNAQLTYLDGKTKDITLVVKEIKYDPSTSAEYVLIEQIPKDISQDTNLITFISKANIIKKDPLIEFSKEPKITYYINSNINLKQMENTNTIIVDKTGKNLNEITGYSIADIKNTIINLSLKDKLIIVVIFLVLIYFIYMFDGIGKIKDFFSNMMKSRKIHYINILVNEALDYLAVNEYDKSALIYKELKLTYENYPDSIKKEIYDTIYDLCNKLDMFYLKELMDRIETYIRTNQKEKTLEEFFKLEGTYRKIEDKYKQEVAERALNLFNEFNKLKK